MTEPGVDERPPSTARDHPPFRMRDRRLVLLPDLRPPSLDEIRWAVRQRRVRRADAAPDVRNLDRHEQADHREPVDMAASIEAPVAEAIPEPEVVELPAAVEVTAEREPEATDAEPAALDGFEPIVEDDTSFDVPDFALPDLEFAELRPWRPAVLPEPEPERAPEPSWVAAVRPAAADAVEVTAAEVEPEPDIEPEPPLVSHLMVVREPAPPEPGRVAVLDEPATEAPATITRLVPLPAEPLDDLAVAVPAEPEWYEEEREAFEEPAAQAASDAEPAPLYWRLLRLRYTRPNGWLRALFFEGAVALAVVLVLAEAASVWTIVVLPLVVAVVVKANDVLAGNLRRAYRQPRRRSGS